LTPVPFELPLRPSEAAQLAVVLYQQIADRRLTDDIRNRLADQTATLGLTSVVAHFGSLEADPVHLSAYFLAVDGLARGAREPLLLHIAPSAEPTSALFSTPLLIGRMRPGGEREVVINATPFGPADRTEIETYARQVCPAFLPRPAGLPVLARIEMDHPDEAAPLAFRTFQTLVPPGTPGFAIPATEECYWSLVWAAIRTGYRDGYAIGGPAESPLLKWLDGDERNLLDRLEELRRGPE
jgi:hypothetical protein